MNKYKEPEKTIDTNKLAKEFGGMSDEQLRSAFFFLFGNIESREPEALQATLNFINEYYPKKGEQV